MWTKCAPLLSGSCESPFADSTAGSSRCSQVHPSPPAATNDPRAAGASDIGSTRSSDHLSFPRSVRDFSLLTSSKLILCLAPCSLVAILTFVSLTKRLKSHYQLASVPFVTLTSSCWSEIIFNCRPWYVWPVVNLFTALNAC